MSGRFMHAITQAVVLAAGKGTRMKSSRAKVLHEVFFAPMLNHVLDALEGLAIAHTVVVTGHQFEAVENASVGYPVRFARQQEQLGTGHAVLAAEDSLDAVPSTVLILCGDTPLIRTGTLAAMIASHRGNNAVLTVMTTTLENPTHYGRIVTEEGGAIIRIVEEKDASDEERGIHEINAGIYCVDREFLFTSLRGVGTDNKQGEVYLTDIVSTARASGKTVYRFSCPDPDEVLGVNSRIELAQAHAELQRRRNLELMAGGVTILHPESVAIDRSATIGADSVIHPSVTILGKTVVGRECSIGPFCIIKDSSIGSSVTVNPFSTIISASIDAGRSLSPYTSIDKE